MSALLSAGRLTPCRSVFFVCDIQERFRPLIWRGESIINRAALMAKACRALNIPVVVTEQNPKAFGPTVSELGVGDSHHVFAKKKFSMVTPEVQERWSSAVDLVNRDQIILVGVEAHVCVAQTVADLLLNGSEVFLICDAISSQRPHDRAVALARMERSGALLHTAESALFDLMRTAEHPDFKTVSGLIKESNLLPNAFANDLAF
jgi:nicotinamidase-related amidase